jgi:glycosyltransferase involved in cell wall biosynthesis
MKLLYIVEDKYPPFRADVVELFGKQLPDKGHQIDWLMQRGKDAGQVESPAVWLGSTVYLTPRSNLNGLLGRIVNNLYALFGSLMVIPLALRNRYDVIQVRDKFSAGLFAWLAARLTGAKFIHWMSYPYAESKLYQASNKLVPYHRLVWLKGQSIRFLLYKLVLPLADHVFVQSERMKEDVVKEGINPSKLTPVPMGIRVEQIGNSSDARAPDTRAPLLLYLGILLRLRQTEMLVRVLALVRQRYPGAMLRYVGEGQQPNDRKAIVDEAERLGLVDAVEVTGFLPMEEAWMHVKAADICFSPFYPIPVLLSTSPTKLIEYMAMAKCVVANEHPEQCQVMEDSGIGRCIPWDEQAFADEVCRLLDDPESARSAAANGPDWVRQNRTYDVIADQVMNVYKRILEN